MSYGVCNLQTFNRAQTLYIHVLQNVKFVYSHMKSQRQHLLFCFSSLKFIFIYKTD